MSCPKFEIEEVTMYLLGECQIPKGFYQSLYDKILQAVPLFVLL